MAKLIDLYDSLVKAPTQSEIEKCGNHMCYLAYATPYMGSIIEYAGRTCYKSFDKITDESYKGFISGLVKSGHESVIEHSNLVYVIFKKTGDVKGKDCDIINRHMNDVLVYNGLLTISETQAFTVISGNLRMFKDLIRKYFEIKTLNGKVNPILDDIFNSFYEFPNYYFDDMIKNFPTFVDPSKFKPNPKFIDYTNAFNINPINDYVSVLNHDYFSMKVKGFVVKAESATSAKRISLPISILQKHNRLTVIIQAPRYITHQLVRHRLASYSQSSQRYVKEEGSNVYMPQTIKDKGMEALANNCFMTIFNTYNTLIENGVPREDARVVLPNASMSTIVVTATLEEWQWIIKMRAHKTAQNFIRDIIAKPISEYIEKYYSSMESNFRTRQVAAPIQTDSAKRYHAKQEHRNNAKVNNGKPKSKNFKKNNKPIKGKPINNANTKSSTQGGKMKQSNNKHQPNKGKFNKPSK